MDSVGSLPHSQELAKILEYKHKCFDISISTNVTNLTQHSRLVSLQLAVANQSMQHLLG